MERVHLITARKFMEFFSALDNTDDKAASQHFRLCIVEMHSRKLRHDDTSAKNVTQYVGYALASQRLK